MKTEPRSRSTLFIVFLVSLLSIGLIQSKVYSHCDTLDGPVVQDARLALEQKDATPVLKWVKKEHEQEIRDAFEKTLAIRTLNPDAQKLADNYFFETLVRIHRAGEGAPYTGLKPAGTVEPGIAAADNALAAGSVDELSDKIAGAVRENIRKRFATAIEKQKHAGDSVEAGREFIEAYVQYIHFVENIHNTLSHGVDHGHTETAGEH